MQKICVIVISLFLSASSWAQDTLSTQRMHHSHTFTTIAIEGDTSIYARRSDESLESIRPVRSGTYVRYYPSGEIMWEQKREENKAHGEMKFYAEDGTLVGNLLFENDTIVDTLFIDKNNNFLFGRFTYNSTVHGGMPRPDGRSNVSRSEGARIYAPLYLVKHGSSKTPQKYLEFSADYNGYFFAIIAKGTYGIFPKNYDLQLITNEMGAPSNRHGGGVNQTWNITAPVKINANYCYLSLHVHSVGYAP